MRWRLATTLAFGMLTGAYFAGTQFAVGFRPEPLEELWYSAAPSLALLLLAAAAGFGVGRWWAALGALGPIVVAVPLHLDGHVTPWHDPTRPPDTAPTLSAVLAALTLSAVLVRLRLGPRRAWTTLDENWSR
jgi:hypothetical protein